jgi:GT2 family glycosyltransferase
LEETRHSATRPAGVTVVIACHTAERWSLLLRAVRSALAQTLAPAEVVVVVDHNPALLGRLLGEFAGAAGVRVIENAGPRGASGTRNTGAAVARTEFVAFLDDDAAAEPGWLLNGLQPFGDPAAVGTGGRVVADWQLGRPSWFPEEFDWVVGATHSGDAVPGIRPVRNVWAENMLVRTSAFRAVDGFRLGFGKLGDHSRPEDTDVCIRMSGRDGAGVWYYVDDARVTHHVPAGRSTFAFFVRRCFHEGRGKAELADLLPVASDALGVEFDYTCKVLPRGFVRHLWHALRNRSTGPAAKAIAIVVGLSVTSAGFIFQKSISAGKGGSDVQPVAAQPEMLEEAG